jgi:hypothetical protein
MSTTIVEEWFIPFDILMNVFIIFAIVFSLIFLFVIIFDKTCQTVPMILVANSCLSIFIFGSVSLSMTIFTLQNDLKQIQYQDSLCVFRGYFSYGSCSVINYSFLLQSIYRYVIVVYPTRLFYQSRSVQSLFIVITWIIAFVFPIPNILTDEIIYNVDNQICLIPLRLSFFPIYAASFTYIIPVLMIMFIYLKLIVYVRGMSKRVIPVNTLFHAQRELKMVRRTVILVSILFTLGFPYALFILMSFFTTPPKYHFRIALIFIDVSLVFVMIALFQFTDPLKTSIIKRIKRRSNVVVATVA